MGIVRRLNGHAENGGFAGAAHFFHLRHHREMDAFIKNVIIGADYNIIVHTRTYMKDMAARKFPGVANLSEFPEWE